MSLWRCHGKSAQATRRYSPRGEFSIASAFPTPPTRALVVVMVIRRAIDNVTRGAEVHKRIKVRDSS